MPHGGVQDVLCPSDVRFDRADRLLEDQPYAHRGPEVIDNVAPGHGAVHDFLIHD